MSVYANSTLSDNLPESFSSSSHLTFCFTHHRVKLEGYQLNPGTGSCIIKKWTMYASSVPEIMEESLYTERKLVQGEIEYYETNFGFHQCFKIEQNSMSQCFSYQTDIEWIELYGIIENIEYISCKNKGMMNMVVTLFLFVMYK